MQQPHPISLSDIRRASRVYVTLSLDPYWLEEGEELNKYDYWSVFGTISAEEDGYDVRILGLGQR